MLQGEEGADLCGGGRGSVGFGGRTLWKLHVSSNDEASFRSFGLFVFEDDFGAEDFDALGNVINADGGPRAASDDSETLDFLGDGCQPQGPGG